MMSAYDIMLLERARDELTDDPSNNARTLVTLIKLLLAYRWTGARARPADPSPPATQA